MRITSHAISEKTMHLIKKFTEWIALKQKLHLVESVPPYVKERDLWWISFGENVGSEVNGKSSLFSRPGLVIKKLSRGFYLVAPTTTKEKTGSWYVPIAHEKQTMYVCLHQVRTIDYRRLSTRFGVVDSNDFARVKQAFLLLYG